MTEKRRPTAVDLPGPDYYVVRDDDGEAVFEGADIFLCMHAMKRRGGGAKLYRQCGILLASMQKVKGDDDEQEPEEPTDADATADDGPADRSGGDWPAGAEKEAEGAGGIDT